VGTITYHKPKGISAIESIKAHCGAEWCAKHVIAATATWDAVFLVGRFHEPDSDVYVPDADGYVRTLLVFKLSLAPRSHYNFGYKDMTETMGPYGCEAPLSILAQCSELRDPVGPQPEYSSLRSASEYRARCSRVAAAKKVKRGLKPGNKVTLAQPGKWGGIDCQTFTVERARLRGRKGMSTVFRAENGMLCGVTAKQLEGATVEEAAS
jgi:hypothetical protein